MSGRIAAFAGPSIAMLERSKWPDVDWFGPASRGDLWAKVTSQHKSIALIDGYYDTQPAIYHKEILDIMARGVLVVGGASIGALRATELSQFGMLGVGEIYQLYNDGTVEGDDEVAILHAPGEIEYQPLTFALVELRFTITRLTNIISKEVLDAVWNSANQLPFVFRTFETLEEALPIGIDSKFVIEQIKKYWVFQKRIDAEQVLLTARHKEQKITHQIYGPATSWETFHKLSALSPLPDGPVWISNMYELLTIARLLWDDYGSVHDAILFSQIDDTGGTVASLVRSFDCREEQERFVRTLRSPIGTLPDFDILSSMLKKPSLTEWLKYLKLPDEIDENSLRPRELYFDSPGRFAEAIEWLERCHNQAGNPK